MWHSLRAERRHRLRRAGRTLRAPSGRLGRPRADALLAQGAIVLLAAATVALQLAALYGLVRALALLPAARQASLVRLEIPGPPYTPPRFVDRSGTHVLSSLGDAAHAPRWLTLSSIEEGHALPPSAVAATCLALEVDCQARPAGVRSGVTAIAHSLRGARDVAVLAADHLAQQDEHASTFGDDPLARALLAGDLSLRYSSSQLLEWLINTQSYGRLAHGVDAAALEYLGAHAEQLGVGEWAALALLAPHPELATDKRALAAARNILLGRLVEEGAIDSGAASAAAAEDLHLATADRSLSPLAADFVSLAQNQLAGHESQLAWSATPLVVTTSFDTELQLQALCTAQTAIARAQAGSVVAAIPTLDGRECEAALFLETVPFAGTSDLAVVAWDVERGDLLAYFTSARGAPGTSDVGEAGTALLPFAYLTTFAKGFTPGSMMLDVPRTSRDDLGGGGTVANADGRYLGPMLASDALREGRVVPAAMAIEEIGSEDLRQTLAGFDLDGKAEGTRGLGQFLTQQVSLLDLTRAYAVFAAGGLDRAGDARGGPNLILSLRDPGGNLVLPAQAREPRPVLSRGLAYLIQDALSDETPASDESAVPSGSLAEGSSLNGTQRWAFAFNASIVVGVLASDKDGFTSAQDGLAVPVARAVIAWSRESYPAEMPAQPAEVSRVRVCSPSGLLPTAACAQIVSQVFLAGTEPTTADTYYQLVAVNRETGRRATVWTPTALVDESVFVDPPAAAQEWAQANGLKLAPQEYDTLPATFEAASDLIIRSPAPFSIVRGALEVIGTADPTGMARYRLQAGQGLYPETWLLIAEGTRPVVEAGLGTWDTTALDGTSTLMLSVNDTQGNLRSMAVPVTVDNRAPEVSFLTPGGEGPLTIGREATLTAVVEASDNLGVTLVEILFDGDLAARFENPPYSMRWTDLIPGLHTLQARAYDAAGNSALSPLLQIEIH
jgi:membrane carboxypeptidase/penicillin-binding protein PbpC